MPKRIGSITLFETEELADILNVNPSTIREYIKDGRIRGQKFGGKWYVSEESLKDHFKEPFAGSINRKKRNK